MTSEENDVLHLAVSFRTPHDLKTWVKDVTSRGEAWSHPSWPGDLWSRAYSEIIEFLSDRFTKTSDVQEYYNCMLYLSHDVAEAELFVLWKDSPNFKAFRSVENSGIGFGDTNTLVKKTPMLQRHRKPYRRLAGSVGYGGRHV